MTCTSHTSHTSRSSSRRCPPLPSNSAARAFHSIYEVSLSRLYIHPTLIYISSNNHAKEKYVLLYVCIHTPVPFKSHVFISLCEKLYRSPSGGSLIYIQPTDYHTKRNLHFQYVLKHRPILVFVYIVGLINTDNANHATLFVS